MIAQDFLYYPFCLMQLGSHKKAQIMLLVALVMVFIMLFVTLQASDMIRFAMKGGRHWEVSAQAKLASRSGLERCLLETKNRESFETATLNATSTELPIPYSYNCEVRGRAECYPSNNPPFGTSASCANPTSPIEYFVPKSGFGSAGGEECRPSRYNPQYDKSTHPCNWNRILFGESITIPLYQTTVDAMGRIGITNPADISTWRDFKVVFRTPCKNPYNPDGNCQIQYTLPILANPTDPQKNLVIATWEITSENCNYGTCVLFANTDETNLITKDSNIRIFNFKSDANTANGNQVLNSTLDKGKSPQKPGLHKMSDFLTNVIGSDWDGNNIQKPTLKLSFIGSLKDASNDPVPYIEYQIVFEGAPLGDVETLVYSQGKASQGDDYYIWPSYARKRTKTNIVDFVIQN